MINLSSEQDGAGVFYQPGGGSYLRAAPIWVYNGETNDFSVPLGVGYGQVIKMGKTVYNVFFEPQFSVVDKGPGQPEWQVFLDFNMQFLEQVNRSATRWLRLDSYKRIARLGPKITELTERIFNLFATSGEWCEQTIYLPSTKPGCEMLSIRMLLPVMLLGFCLPLTAQVYKSTDEEGNVTFSDQPTPESEEVKIEKTNTGDAVKVPPPSSEPVEESKPEVVEKKTAPAPEGELIGVEEHDDDWYLRRHRHPIHPHPRHR